MAKRKKTAAPSEGQTAEQAFKDKDKAFDPWIRNLNVSQASVERTLSGDEKEITQLSEQRIKAEKVKKFAPFISEVYRSSAEARIAQDKLRTDMEIADNKEEVALEQNKLARLTSWAWRRFESAKTGIKGANAAYKLQADFDAWADVEGTRQDVTNILRSQSTSQQINDLRYQIDSARFNASAAEKAHIIDGALNYQPSELTSKRQFAHPGFLPDSAPDQGSKTGSGLGDLVNKALVWVGVK